MKHSTSDTYTDTIEKRLAEAEIEAAWKEAKNQKSITAYRSFMRRYPQSSFVVEANNRIATIEAALEAEEMRRQNVDNQAIEREKQAKVAAAKLAADKLEADQKRLWQQEAEQLKKDKDKLDAQKLAQDQRAETEKRRVEEAASLEKQRLADVKKQRLKQVEKARLEKEKAAQVVDNQETVNVVEPSFLQKYKMHLMGVGVLVALLMWAVLREKESVMPDTTPSVPTASSTVLMDNEASDFQKAMTIPDMNAYLQRYPNGKNRVAVMDKLAKLTSALNTHLNNVRSQIKNFPESAKENLDKARAIDPTNADVVKFSQQLK